MVFHNLEPGEYLLQIRATNSSGEWMGTERNVKVIVTPKFKETSLAQFLMSLIVVLILIAAMYIWRYVKQLDQKHRETLDAYLQLLNHNQKQTDKEHEEYRMQLLENVRVEPQNDKFIKSIVEYIDMHISNADIDIDQMAQHAAVSRSHLNHKLKQILGVTPSEIIREARIKHACLLLHDPNRSINDVAYACGFADPKYFSKCFKASTGVSPTKYRLTRM
jgi:AraC-like DNA-binding protein